MILRKRNLLLWLSVVMFGVVGRAVAMKGVESSSGGQCPKRSALSYLKVEEADGE